MESSSQSAIVEICRSTGRKKLTEDEYTEKLESIIEAQFFPHIAPLRELHSYLTNTSRKYSLDKLKYKLAQTDHFNEHEISLSQFFRQYISEDNSSFETLQEKSIAEHRKKFHWNYEQEDGKKSGMLALYYMNGKVLSIEERRLFDKILITDKHEDAAFDIRKNGLDYGKFRVRNQLFFTPELKDSEEICNIPPQLITNNGNSLQLTNYEPQSQLSNSKSNIKRAEKIIQTANTSTLSSYVTGSRPSTTDNGSNNDEEFTLHDLLMAVLHRIPGDEMTGPSPLERPQIPSPRDPSPIISSGANGQLISKYNNARENNHNNNQKRKYEEVSMSPCPVPISSSALSFPTSFAFSNEGGNVFAVPASPLMTWGQVIGGPIPIDEEATIPKTDLSIGKGSGSGGSREGEGEGVDGPAFRMQPPSRRELMGRALDSHKMRSKGREAVYASPSPFSVVHPSSAAASPAPSCVSYSSSAADGMSVVSKRSGATDSAGRRKTLSSLTPAAQALAQRISQGRGKKSDVF